jgi:hypothetical protein
MDESLASEEAEEETTPEPEEEEEQKEDPEAERNRAFAAMRRENRSLRQELDAVRQQIAALQKPAEKEEDAYDAFPVEDDAYLKAGDVKRLVQATVKKSLPKQGTDKAMLADILNASEALAQLRHSDYAEVVEGFREELDDDPAVQAFIIGAPGTHMNAGERLYQFALMKRGQAGGSRRETIEAVVNKKKKPATMGVVSKKTASSSFSPVGKTMDEVREFRKKHPDEYEKVMKKLESGTA